MPFRPLLVLILCFPFFILSMNLFKMVHERADLLTYCAQCIDGPPVFSFAKINRTSFALNTSFTTIQDFADNQIFLTVFFDKLYGNEYKRTGTKITMNLCKFYKSNMFGVKDLFEKYGNLRGCNITKGFYQLTNFLPDSEKFPNFLPFGNYRVVIMVDEKAENTRSLMKLRWFARVEQLPR